MKNSEINPETNIRIIDFETMRRRKAANHWMSLSGAEQMTFYSNLWVKDREIVWEFLQTPEGADVSVPRLQLHPKRSSKLFASIYYMKEDVKLAFLEFVIGKFGYGILSAK